MALKPDRIESHTDISFFMTTTAERGGVVVATTGANNVGVSMDDAGAQVEYTAAPSGKSPMGVLLNDVVNYDLTKQHINWYKDEVQVGGKVTLLRQGQVTTDMVTGSPVAGSPAYVGVNGNFDVSSDSGNRTKVGTFLSGKDSDGYAKIDVNIS
jgi:hypothetical protein